MSKSLLGAILLAFGILILAYGGFSYTQQTHHVDLGFVKLQAKDQERVDLPEWLGVSSAALGVILLLGGRRR